MKTKRRPTISKIDGHKFINFTTEVEIEEYVDVDISLKLEDILDDIKDSLTNEDMRLIADRNREMYHDDLQGQKLKDHLCDLCGLSHMSANEKIVLGIQSLLSFC